MRRMSRRLAPIAFIAAISPVCSPMSVLIVFESSTRADSSATSVTTVMTLETFSKPSLYG
jgi:hypothetical protein